MSADAKDETRNEETATDVFSEAFEKLAEIGNEAKPSETAAALDTKPEPAPEPEKPVAEVAEQTAAPVESTAEDSTHEETTTQEAQPAVEEATPNTAPEISDEDLLARFASLVRKAEPVAEERRVEPAVQQAQTPQEIYTPEELKTLTEYEKDWPDVAKAEAIRRKAEYRDLVGYVFNEVARELRPVMESVKTMAEQTHLQQLHATIKDYDDVRDKVIDWVAQQPAYLQPAYQHVIQQGTVDEINDLVERYRSATGAPAPAAPRAATRRTGSELPTATKQAAAALAPVSSKRSAVIQGVESGDFDSAFAAFADKL